MAVVLSDMADQWPKYTPIFIVYGPVRIEELVLVSTDVIPPEPSIEHSNPQLGKETLTGMLVPVVQQRGTV